ncbi:MAG TPA: tetratricopeptide repeat protein [Edaphobacter sp.]|nr:tetratricopeptide repeat protein [Edaphobacter sp.]
MLKGKELKSSINEVTLMLEAGCVYRYAGRFHEARDIFQGVRALLPTQEVADLALAGVFMDEGKLAEAEAHCRRVLELNHASAAAYTQLAEIQLLQKNSASARQSLQRSLEISPNGPTAALTKLLLKLTSMIESRT